MLLPWLLLLALLKVSSVSPARIYSHPDHDRVLREQECNEGEYWHRGNCCRTCPAGTRVSMHCTMNHVRAICEACPPGYFTAAPNGLESCLPCLTCKDDKVLVQECTPETDAKCECKPGYYCSPDEPCEICNRCSRCGEGLHVKKPCTSTTDTVCEDVFAQEPTSAKTNVKNRQTVTVQTKSFNDLTGKKALPTEPPDDPAGSKLVTVQTNSDYDLTGKKALPTEPPDDPDGSKLGLSISLPIVTVIIILGIIIGCCYHKRKTKDRTQNSLIGPTQNSSENSSLQSIRAGDNEPTGEELCPERQRLMTPFQEPTNVENVINQMAVPAVQGAQGNSVENNTAEPLGGDVETEESPQLGAICEECGKPQPCDTQWITFIYIVTDNVQPDYILRLVRQLHLNKATIEHIIKDNSHNCKERNYNLLFQWREQKGTQASMRAVLRELRDMDLAGCCENIVNSLRTKRIPIS